jgi:glycyl-tRNA synthetase beta chain
VVEEHLVEPAERALAVALAAEGIVAERLFDSGRYADSMTHLATLRAPVDAFFDQVMVMAPEARLRDNRLALLSRLNTLFTRVADLSRLHDA